MTSQGIRSHIPLVSEHFGKFLISSTPGDKDFAFFSNYGTGDGGHILVKY